MICDFVHVMYIASRVEGLEICNPAARNEAIRKLTKPRYRQGCNTINKWLMKHISELCFQGNLKKGRPVSCRFTYVQINTIYGGFAPLQVIFYHLWEIPP